MEKLKREGSKRRSGGEKISADRGFTIDETLKDKRDSKNSDLRRQRKSTVEKKPSSTVDSKLEHQENPQNRGNSGKLISSAATIAASIYFAASPQTKSEVPPQEGSTAKMRISIENTVDQQNKRSTRRLTGSESLLTYPARVSMDKIILPEKPLPVFEVHLEKHLQNYAPRQLSIVLETCICALYDKGIHTESLLRIPGTHNDVKMLKQLFDHGKQFDILKFDIHAIASTLKLYLRELPEPLIPTMFYEKYLQAMLLPTKSEQLSSVKRILREMPALNRLNMRHLIVFLNDVANLEFRNKMNAKALGICIGSNLLRMPRGPKKEFGDCLSEIAHFGARNSGVQFLIENAMQLFPDYVVTPRSLYASPGGIYARSMNMAPKRFSDIRDFFRKRIDKFRSDDNPSKILNSAISMQETPSHFDVRHSVKRNSSTSLTGACASPGPGAEKASRRSLDSASGNRKSGSRSLVGSPGSPGTPTYRLSTARTSIEDAVFEPVEEEAMGATAGATAPSWTERGSKERRSTERRSTGIRI